MTAALIKATPLSFGPPDLSLTSPPMVSPARYSSCGYPAQVHKVTESFSPTPARFSLHSNGDELILLHQEIEQIDNTVRQLNEARAAKCRRLNEIQSLISNIPSNVLCKIFEFACPPSEYNSSHQRVRKPNGKPLILPIFALSAVSSRWRQIILDAPQFWRKLDWYWKYHLSPESTSALLRTYFTRTGSYPFDLKLTIVEKWEIEDMEPFSDSDHIDGHLDVLKRTIFFENAKKIGSLKLDAPTRWLRLISKSFGNLTDLSLRSQRIDERIDLSDLPHLTRVKFVNIKTTPTLPWRQITHIHLIRHHTNVSFELLTNCPNIVEFHSQHPNSVKNGSVSLHLAHPVTLHHLEWLEWSCIGSFWDDALFRYTYLPSLRKLCLTGNIPWSPDTEHNLTNFLTHLPSSIDLELGFVQDFVHGPTPLINTIFHALPSLQNLTITEDDHDYLERVLKVLTPPSSSPSSPSSSLSSKSSSSSPSSRSPPSSPISRSSSDQTIYLPSLRRLSLRAPDREYAKDDVFTRLRGAPQQLLTIGRGDIFLELIRQRWKVLHIPSFSLDLNFSPTWRLGDRAELVALVEDGFQLDLVEKSERVGWLPAV